MAQTFLRAFCGFAVLLMTLATTNGTKTLNHINLAASNPKINIIGRVNIEPQSGVVLLDWPGIQITFSVSGVSEIGLWAIGSGNSAGNTTWNVLLNSQLSGTFQTGPSTAALYYKIAALDATQKYDVEINKRTEAEFGLVAFERFVFHGASPVVLSEPITPKDSSLFKFEFIGDSTPLNLSDAGQNHVL
jgi:hypothetical protein